MKRSIPFGRPMLGEEEKQAVAEVLDGLMLVHGPKAKEFESDFADWCGAPGALSVSSCTAGLHLFWFDNGIGPGDEVIVPAQTHTATAHAVEYCGAKPVFVDADPLTGNIDPDAVEAAVTPNTRGISLVHFLGIPADMKRIMETARKHDLVVLEDCALAIGTYYDGVHAGLLGDAGAFSFYPVKHMTTAEGGMIISRNADLLTRLERKKAFGVDRFVGERKIPGVYDVTMLGFNYRMNEMQAAIGIEQIRKLNGFLETRKNNFSTLAKALDDIDEVTVIGRETPENSVSSCYCLSVVLDEPLRDKRTALIENMKEQGVGTSVYYPAPVPCLTYYKDKYGMDFADFPVAQAISSGLALPVGPHLDQDDMAYIVEALKQGLSEV
ncbi:UDP-4-amino-4-deoxy-L-arabinose--oxoglutarate aminotransferase [Pseudodesulfovibrio hydrargyri]|uniref:UDP-4-amino-4-deoxy-L-arabinose--oxoglutarate aminotransferase n=2 Tax=Pseudodesulfovibrio hydrargyri TaxID=2125990 RepID=A0A1J5NEC4_9BACT|nr:UDP-4-amino-4-deoxy-L-arabinose--oxoglutarate aminotransferase [Pseudodesulfovibrio hydrargyri]